MRPLCVSRFSPFSSEDCPLERFCDDKKESPWLSIGGERLIPKTRRTPSLSSGAGGQMQLTKTLPFVLISDAFYTRNIKAAYLFVTNKMRALSLN